MTCDNLIRFSRGVGSGFSHDWCQWLHGTNDLSGRATTERGGVVQGGGLWEPTERRGAGSVAPQVLGGPGRTAWPPVDHHAPSPSAHTDGPCLRLYNLNAIKSISHEEFVAGGDLGADSDNTIHGGSSRALEGQEVGCPSVRRAPCSVSWHRAPRRVALGEISIAAEDSAPLSAMDCWRATLLTGPTTTPADARHPNLATASRLSHAGIGRHLLFG